MPSFWDSSFIFILVLILFGPKKLPELARQLGKLMAEFRRASNEFRSQMDEELRIADQAEQQKKIAAMEAAAPVTPSLADLPEPEHPHIPTEASSNESLTPESVPTSEPATSEPDPAIEPLPIATSGDISLMPPATGLPTPRTTENAALAPILETIPHDPEPQAAEPHTPSHSETPIHG